MEQRKELSYLFEGLLQIPPAFERSIAHLSLDSRDMQPGGLFFARQGAQASGEAFCEAALAAGAIVLVTEAEQLSLAHQGYAVRIGIPNLDAVIAQIAARFYDYPAESLDVIGVTGTNGKTTVSQLVAQLLDRLGHACGIVGTLGWGFFERLTPAINTTPDAIQLHRQLAELKKQGAQAVALEVSSHALVQQRVAGLPIDVAVLTNLSRDHLDYHGSMEAYADAKQRLFLFPGLSAVVLNAEDPFGRHLAELCHARVPVRAFSLKADPVLPNSHSLLAASEIEPSEQGISARISWQGEYHLLHSPLLGQFNLANLLAAMQAVMALGYPLEQLLPWIPSLQPVLGRMQRFALPNGATAVVDFAHSPDALQQALAALRPHCVGQLGCLFGCGGDRDTGKRPLMAQQAERLADWLILTNDNPRSERPEQILNQVEAGLSGRCPYQIVPDRARAITDALNRLQPGDLLLIAGKGHENYQWIGTDKQPFSDQAQVAHWLEGQAQ